MNKIKNTASGSADNLIHYMLGGTVEQQEEQGRNELIIADQLPKTNNDFDRSALEIYKKIGVEIVEDNNNDDLFFSVKLPKGWSKKCTGHNLWTDLLDDKGRKRACIFYKAAFYDRKAFINFEKKITMKVDRLGFINNDYSQEEGSLNYISNKTPFCGVIKDFDGKILFKTDEIRCDIELTKKGFTTDEYKMESYKIKNKLREECLEWLKIKFPDWEKEEAYW